MAEKTVQELTEIISVEYTAESMDVESLEPGLELKGEDGGSEANGEANSKRERANGEPEERDGASKKQKVEKSVEEERLKKLEEGDQEGEVGGSGTVRLGPKVYDSAVEMFDYFYKFLHYWPPNLNVNKYEHMVLLDLLKKGHAESDKKIGSGVEAFQVRYHPMWKSRCFFLIREDASVDDFSFRKCVDHILPLPEDMKIKSDANKTLGGGGGKHRGGRSGGGGRGGRGRGHGRGGKSRN